MFLGMRGSMRARTGVVAVMATALLALAAVMGSAMTAQPPRGVAPPTPHPSQIPTVGPRPSGDAIFRLFLAPDGSDSNSGLTPRDPLRTLARTQELLVATRPTTDVEVRIAAGTYVAGQTTWQFYLPGHSISFMPADYDYGEGAADIASRPIFRGNGRSAWWFYARLPSGNRGGNTNLRFYYLQVERYARGGLAINGGIATSRQGIRVPSTVGANRNTVQGMLFQHLGSKYSSGGIGYGGVDLVNSSDNAIRAGLFRYHENTGAQAGLIHGVYLAHGSKRNVVSGNRFYVISGGPLHTRNDSDDNTVFDNRFERTGSAAAYNEWFCNTRCVLANPGQPRECPSYGNIFRDNDVVSGYAGGRLASWRLASPGDHSGGSGCKREGQPRIRVSGNT
jgi:hypothetical protein